MLSYHGPARAPAAWRPAARPSSSSRSDHQNQPPARHDNNSADLGIATHLRARRAAVQSGQRGQRDGRPDAEQSLSPPHHHLLMRRARITLKPLKPHAGHWECERSKSTGHFSTCCSQGKVQLPTPPQPDPEYRNLLEGSGSEPKAFRENARPYNNALSFTSLAAHFDQTQVGTLGPSVFRVFGRLYHQFGALIPAVNQRPALAQTWFIDPANTDTRQVGPDGAESRIQRTTLTKLESVLRTGNRFVRQFAWAKVREGRDRRTHNLPTSSTEMAMFVCDSDTHTETYQIVSSLHRSPMPLQYPLIFSAGGDGYHPSFPLCGFKQAGSPFLGRPPR
ncbi:BZ3500_MvSof-1268-A1-R1_Chr1-3g01552 [Microbotryum saponariae]|uniref:BZ3500_MvSof-1268-A1-R1_Chr1-3g01552 protein n=1 Tax=Microbotryum saponariae TaxID=289078 RepID=A0A2X0KJZ1_9BASI|nr:BZ3500_MvSof-1268-A1-R1_Chr1-3g01552 [Microbotryum saponariae]SCZ94012.1 BZ3501_MvSof-1269-A2-R1_Chr1-3g01154 [Microbotryum saponariae]